MTTIPEAKARNFLGRIVKKEEKGRESTGVCHPCIKNFTWSNKGCYFSWEVHWKLGRGKVKKQIMSEEEVAKIATQEFVKESWVGLETLRMQQVGWDPDNAAKLKANNVECITKIRKLPPMPKPYEERNPNFKPPFDRVAYSYQGWPDGNPRYRTYNPMILHQNKTAMSTETYECPYKWRREAKAAAAAAAGAGAGAAKPKAKPTKPQAQAAQGPATSGGTPGTSASPKKRGRRTPHPSMPNRKRPKNPPAAPTRVSSRVPNTLAPTAPTAADSSFASLRARHAGTKAYKKVKGVWVGPRQIYEQPETKLMFNLPDGLAVESSQVFRAGDRRLADYIDEPVPEDAEFEVDEVVHQRTVDREVELRVKWAGYELDPDAWTDASELKDMDVYNIDWCHQDTLPDPRGKNVIH
ncbi:hypothetical protein WJX73_003512 [Symbiochloris irregularis]|uniref:Chromo domain-containing protein n=1 Tax=Symbiochloris irregularis TaxID=706552 RepID=A0AAW1PPB5_9CHLO